MKILAIINFLFILSTVFLYSYVFGVEITAADDEKDTIEIITEVYKILSMIDIQSEQMISIYRKGGCTSQYKLKIITKGVDKAFAEVIDPPREHGIQMLRFGEMIWRYLPNRKKSHRITGRQSFMGSDVRDIDFLRLNILEDYITCRIVENSHNKYLISFQGINSRFVYAKLKLWVNKRNLRPIKQEYYSLNGRLVKTLFYRDYRDFNGVIKPCLIEIKSASFPDRMTTIELISFRKNVKNRLNIFHRSNLGRIVSNT